MPKPCSEISKFKELLKTVKQSGKEKKKSVSPSCFPGLNLLQKPVG